MEFAMICACAGFSAACLSLAAMKLRERNMLLRAGGLRSEGCLQARIVAALSREVASRRSRFKICAVFALIAAIWSVLVLPGPRWLTAVLGACLGAVTPLILSRAASRRRTLAIEIALPGALDWLALSVEAGEGFSQALVRIAGGLKHGPLKEDMQQLCAEMRIGVPRADALSAMAARSGSADLSAVVSLLVQADALGTGVGPVLRVFSRRLRARRLARAERRGAVAAQKALLPLAFCIMPATFVVVFGPLVARLATGGIEAFF